MKFSPSWYLSLQGESLSPTAMAACSGSCQYVAFWMFKHTWFFFFLSVVFFLSFLDTNRPWCVFFPVYCWIWFAKILHQVFACSGTASNFLLLVYPRRALVSVLCLPRWMSGDVVPLLTVCKVYQADVIYSLKYVNQEKTHTVRVVS